jgi:translation elongation factor EF-Tu-like GTPase
MMWRATATSGQGFRMAIEKVIHLSGRPGLYLAGKISSGTVRTGDHLNLLHGETVVREVTCDGVEFVDVDIHRPELVLVAVHVRSLRRGDASEGQTLASVPDGGRGCSRGAGVTLSVPSPTPLTSCDI